MTTVSLLVPLSILPGMALLDPIEIHIGDGIVIADAPAASSAPFEVGQTMVVSFVLTDGLNRVLADSSVRGLPYSFRYGAPDLDPMLAEVTQGMRHGSERFVFFSPDRYPELSTMLPPKTDLTLRIRADRP